MDNDSRYAIKGSCIVYRTQFRNFAPNITVLGARGVGWAAPAPRLARMISFSSARATERRAGLHLLRVYGVALQGYRGPGNGDERLQHTSV
jgi:hypothetical protein